MLLEFLISLSSVGYIGVFLASVIGSATVIFPLPIFLVIFMAGAALNPFLVGIVAGVGSAIGELIAYGVGFGGRKLLEKKIELKKKGLGYWLRRGQKWMHRTGGFFVVFLFAATPLPDDVIGIICGSIRYDIKKFFIACLLGKIVLSLLIAYAGFYGINWVLGYLGG